ncbi:MAG: hypothetical protein IAF94_17815, partial [Pirellulaceae bacterium]|nr:hypothetical protein [Pirellulaceae bacterium]
MVAVIKKPKDAPAAKIPAEKAPPEKAPAEKAVPLRITLVDGDGNTVDASSLATSAELRFLAEQAR